MTTVRKKMITWLHTQTFWVQKAAESLLKEQPVDAVQLDIIKELLKTPGGQAKNNNVDFSFFDNYVAPNVKVKLKSIGNKTINALKYLRYDRLMRAKNILETDGLDLYDPLAKATCSDISVAI